jgi:hypothetical protein
MQHMCSHPLNCSNSHHCIRLCSHQINCNNSSKLAPLLRSSKSSICAAVASASAVIKSTATTAVNAAVASAVASTVTVITSNAAKHGRFSFLDSYYYVPHNTCIVRTRDAVGIPARNYATRDTCKELCDSGLTNPSKMVRPNAI